MCLIFLIWCLDHHLIIWSNFWNMITASTLFWVNHIKATYVKLHHQFIHHIHWFWEVLSTELTSWNLDLVGYIYYWRSFLAGKYFPGFRSFYFSILFNHIFLEITSGISIPQKHKNWENIISGQDDVKDAVFPLLKLLSITLYGLILSHPKVQLIPKATFKILSKLLFVLFLPSITLVNPSLLTTLSSGGSFPVNVVASTGIGCILACWRH